MLTLCAQLYFTYMLSYKHLFPSWPPTVGREISEVWGFQETGQKVYCIIYWCFACSEDIRIVAENQAV